MSRFWSPNLQASDAADVLLHRDSGHPSQTGILGQRQTAGKDRTLLWIGLSVLVYSGRKRCLPGVTCRGAELGGEGCTQHPLTSDIHSLDGTKNHPDMCLLSGVCRRSWSTRGLWHTTLNNACLTTHLDGCGPLCLQATFGAFLRGPWP